MGLFDGTLILSDLDGTLLNSKRKISKGNIEAVRYFIENGGRFSFATGRNITGMKYFTEEMPVNAPGVLSNGAVIYDFKQDRIVKAFPVGEVGESLADEVSERFPDVGIEVLMPDGSHILKENYITEGHIKYTGMPSFREGKEKIPKPWLHMLLCCDPGKIKRLEVFVKEKFGDKLFFQYSADFFIEVLIKGVNKGVSALYIAKMLNIHKSRFFTVGDGQNDTELISCCENAYAPVNAHPDVLKLSPKLLPDNDSDSVAELIKIIEGRIKNEHPDIREKQML